MPTKHIRGITLAYDDLGPSTAAPLVFIHGHPFNRSMWIGQINHFKKTRRIILPDLRGYGEPGVTTPDTPAPGAPTPSVLLDEMALDIIHLLDELHIEKAVFIGLSMGGQI